MASKRIPNDRLRALLAEAEWTSASFARAVNRAGREIGLALSYDRTSVAHWLAGSRPRRPVPQLVAEVLSRRLGRTITAVVAGFPHDGGERAGQAAPHSRAGAIANLAELTSTDADAVHSRPLQQSPYLAAPKAVPRWREVSRMAGAGTRPAGPRAGQTEVATLKAAVQTFAKGLDRHGGGHARSALSAFLADDVVPWLNRPANAQVHQQLLTEAARLAFVRARLYSDSGFHGAAQLFYAAALRLANEAGDRSTWAVILRGMSSQSLALKHLRAALSHAENAYAALPAKTSPASRSFVAAQLAVARAVAGRRRDALSALEEAGRSWEENGSAAGPFGAYPRAALEFQRAQTLRGLGDVRGAIEALSVSSEHRRPDDRRGHALTHAARTKLLLRSGHVEEACGSWRAFLETGSGLQSTSTDRAGAALRREFLPYRSYATVGALLAKQRRN
ncbi:hypothetical protein GCM10009837_82240 [Streptomyces durmitorensis]|uniref:Transcriptional regulator n=1 Tax=Streptomyces durmitorensis TaxID=319947 RepID=A0ABY4Q6V6_9ACTN|nr:hypothetical protein [Streptomyces durmitorensis]UQT61099.1 hypothetical protein M4V62_41855 [Streptomyces durmitorensis]